MNRELQHCVSQEPPPVTSWGHPLAPAPSAALRGTWNPPRGAGASKSTFGTSLCAPHQSGDFHSVRRACSSHRIHPGGGRSKGIDFYEWIKLNHEFSSWSSTNPASPAPLTLKRHNLSFLRSIPLCYSRNWCPWLLQARPGVEQLQVTPGDAQGGSAACPSLFTAGTRNYLNYLNDPTGKQQI